MQNYTNKQNIGQEKEKQEWQNDCLYAQDNLKNALETARLHKSYLTIQDIARTLAAVLDKEEIEVLVKELRVGDK